MNLFNERAKWWSVEMVFQKHLTARQLRRVDNLDPFQTGSVDRDYAVWDQWYDKWPNVTSSDEIVGVLTSLKVPCKVRVAPFGRDCTGCEPDDPEHRCEPGWVGGCAPVWRDDDWITIDGGAL